LRRNKGRCGATAEAVTALRNSTMERDPKYRDYNLPLPFEMAPRRFGEWSDTQLLREQDDVTPTTPLFHYTGSDALEGILRNRHLWCFSHAQQDDREEFQYSLGVARIELERIAIHGKEFGKEFAICVMDLINQNVLTSKFKFYLFSVSMLGASYTVTAKRAIGTVR
jgi:hypothetical protein